MKISLLFLSAALAAGTVSAAEPPGAPVRDRALMLYFTKSFGSDQRQNRTPLAFGLKLQQSATFDLSRTVALFDMRYALGGRTTLAAGGALMLDSASYGASSGEESWDNPWLYAGIVVGVAGFMCLAEEVICEDNDDDDYTPPPSEPSPGLGRGN